MKLREEFKVNKDGIKKDVDIERLINLSPELEDWFLRNQDKMATLGLTYQGCCNKRLEEIDDKILGLMAHACFTWLESTYEKYDDDDKINGAIDLMNRFYESKEEGLSSLAQEAYRINFISNKKEL